MDKNAKDVTAMVVLSLRRIIRAVDLRSRFLVTRYGITGPQLTVLKELSAHNGISVSELTKAIHLSQATVTGILDRLEKPKLIQRQRSDRDKRFVQIWLTEKGKKNSRGLPAFAPGRNSPKSSAGWKIGNNPRFFPRSNVWFQCWRQNILTRPPC